MTSKIITEEVLKKLQSLSDDGYMYDIISYLEDYIEKGIENNLFTMEDVLGDIEFALWIAYADINIDEYERYFHAVSWLQNFKDDDVASGVWYYRYSVCLMSIGKLEEACKYSEMGVKKDPSYPWGWLLISGLRSHFGDRKGAFEAVETGMRLLPNDYEFMRRKRDLEENKSLPEMEMHFIDEEIDKALLSGDPSMEEVRKNKLLSISSIVCDNQNLRKVISALKTDSWEAVGMYCSCSINIDGEEIDCEFEMNQASLSNLFDEAWIKGLFDAFPIMKDDAIERIQDDLGERVNMDDIMLSHLCIYRDRSCSVAFHEGDILDCIYVDFDEKFEVKEGLEFSPESRFNVETYEEFEIDEIENHIADHFGNFDTVMHEIVSPDLHIDICLIEPSKDAGRDYYTLVTCGMGAHIMDLPEEAESYVYNRAELFICLPSDWKVDNPEDEWFWPIHSLKSLARYPKGNDTFFGWGHTISLADKLADKVNFNSFILLGPQESDDESGICELSTGDKVAFYQVIPIYDEEKEYKRAYGVEALLDKMDKVSHVVDINRENTCK